MYVWCVCGLCMHMWVTCKGGTIMEALQIHYTESGLNPNSWWAAGGQPQTICGNSTFTAPTWYPSPYGYQLGNIICCSKYVQLSGLAVSFNIKINHLTLIHQMEATILYCTLKPSKVATNTSTRHPCYIVLLPLETTKHSCFDLLQKVC